jgi:hypothetical protein
VIDAHDSPRVTHVVLCAPKEPKDILVRFGAKDDATLKQGSRKDVAFVKDGWINACLEVRHYARVLLPRVPLSDATADLNPCELGQTARGGRPLSRLHPPQACL